MTRALLLLTALSVSGFTACGGSVAGSGEIAAQLAGQWEGSLFIEQPGTNGVTIPRKITVTLPDSTHATFDGLCPSGPPVVISGEGTRLVAATTITCDPAPIGGCEAASYVFTALEVALYSGNSLNITANGTLVGCDAVTPMRVVFDATKQ
jgi:hypothetical protein